MSCLFNYIFIEISILIDVNKNNIVDKVKNIVVDIVENIVAFSISHFELFNNLLIVNIDVNININLNIIRNDCCVKK